MSFDALLVNTMSVERPTFGSGSAFAHTTPTYTAILTGQKCRLSARSGRTVVDGKIETIMEQVIYCGDIGVQARDHCVIDSRTFDVQSVLPKQDSDSSHHKMLSVTEIK